MVTLNREEEEKAHKELHKKIYDCVCKPYLKPHKYCDDCKKNVTDFMDMFGAGVLTRDEKVEELQKENLKLKGELSVIQKKLEEKIKRVEELKKELVK